MPVQVRPWAPYKFMKVIVTGGSGFIGSRLIKRLIESTNHKVLNIDNLLIGSNQANVKSFENNERYSFTKKDISDSSIPDLLRDYKPDVLMHLAAESHVDRSIESPESFLKTNIFGTFNLLEAIKNYNIKQKKEVLFHHISTDEVFGELNENDNPFSEISNYSPNSPYSASKAASDHLVRAWGTTYDLPYIITNCSNNYGPHQHIEKLIPKVIFNGLSNQPIPVYGKGRQIRDWLFVDDHVDALIKVIEKGKIFETYNIGGNSELRNVDVVKKICSIIEEIKKIDYGEVSENIVYVSDRPGHDFRYAINATKIRNDLGWYPKYTFDKGIRETIEWYISNQEL